MTPERMAGLVARWARLYTRDLPTPVAERRVTEIDADLHDHISHERAEGATTRASRAASRPGWFAASRRTPPGDGARRGSPASRPRRNR